MRTVRNAIEVNVPVGQFERLLNQFHEPWHSAELWAKFFGPAYIGPPVFVLDEKATLPSKVQLVFIGQLKSALTQVLLYRTH